MLLFEGNTRRIEHMSRICDNEFTTTRIPQDDKGSMHKKGKRDVLTTKKRRKADTSQEKRQQEQKHLEEIENTKQ